MYLKKCYYSFIRLGTQMQEVEFDNLEIGKIYYIEKKSYKPIYSSLVKIEHSGTFQKFMIDRTCNIPCAMFTNISKPKHLMWNNVTTIRPKNIWKFYESKKDKIQKDMENRALHLILQNVICDPSFKTEAWI